MAEATRIRPIEYQSPRPLILTLCFIWGIGVGFGLNFFRAPDVVEQPGSSSGQQDEIAERAVPSELERRRRDIPNVTEIEPAPILPATQKQSITEMSVEPPTAVLTTEGGLTGRTARPIVRQPGTTPLAPPPGAPAGPPSPPPLPDLAP